MRRILTALALASMMATPALAKSPSHLKQTRHLYMYQGVNQNDFPATISRGKTITDPDAWIRGSLIREYQQEGMG